MHILIVEDEKKIAEIIEAYLEKENFKVTTASDGNKAWDILEKEIPDLIVLDIMLPGIDGVEILKRVRSKSNVPVIMLTAKSDEIDRILGLELGADDYVTKPFSPRELVARIKAVTRRKNESIEEDEISVSGLKINTSRHEAKMNGKLITLTVTEFEILKAIAKSPGRVFTRLQLVELVQGDYFEGYERTIDTHIKNLRQKIEKDPANPTFIKTVYGIGYKFEAQNEVEV